MILALILLWQMFFVFCFFQNPPTEADRRALPRMTTGMCALYKDTIQGAQGQLAAMLLTIAGYLAG